MVGNLEYRLKRALTFDLTVGSRSNFYNGCRGCFCWVSYGVAIEGRGCLVANLEYRFIRAITFDPTVGSCSNFYSGFQRQFSLG